MPSRLGQGELPKLFVLLVRIVFATLDVEIRLCQYTDLCVAFLFLSPVAWGNALRVIAGIIGRST